VLQLEASVAIILLQSPMAGGASRLDIAVSLPWRSAMEIKQPNRRTSLNRSNRRIADHWLQAISANAPMRED
jgi:hypothetical protein